MTIDKAIQILEFGANSAKILRKSDLGVALKLGIEALKFYLQSSHYATGCLLPGQTGETEEKIEED